MGVLMCYQVARLAPLIAGLLQGILLQSPRKNPEIFFHLIGSIAAKYSNIVFRSRFRELSLVYYYFFDSYIALRH